MRGERLWRGGSASTVAFFLFFSFVEYVDIDALAYLKAPGPYSGAEGRWRNVVLTVSATVRGQLCVSLFPVVNNNVPSLSFKN